MRHNKIIGWESFFEALERVQKFSPWLSRQIAKRAAEWPFWFSGLSIRELTERQVWIHMPVSTRNSVEGEICQGHLVLAAELALRLLLLRHRQEFPFQFRLRGSRLEIHNPVDQSVDIKFEITFGEWERIRMELARSQRSAGEFVFPARLRDGRLAASFTFQVGFQLEKFLPA
jgi:hypothetical protein